MGQRSVIFHAFLASLVPIAHAVGVAPSGLSSSDFYRSRRFRTTNSTPLGASIHDSASAESAVAVLDDLSRKSRVLLAQKRSGNKDDHHLLTWNAGGGAPQPEFLGGPWETDFDGMYSKVEQMTGVLLFEIAKCEVDFTNKDFKKYASRYKKMYDDFQTLKTNEKEEIKKALEALEGLTFDTLLGGLKATFDTKYPGKAKALSWTTNAKAAGEQTCTLQSAIADQLGLCPSKAKKDQKKTEAKLPCDGFDLKSEGCWKARGALPVYGESFFALYGKRQAKENRQAYWELFMKGLEEQESLPEKGCNPKPEEKFPKNGSPGKHIGLTTEDGGPEYAVTVKEKTEKVKPESTPKIFTFEEWSKTAAWDTLLMELTTLSIAFLNQMEGTETLTLKDDDKYKEVPYINDKGANEVIAEIVDGAGKKLSPDVIFLQEGGAATQGEGYAMVKAAKDTSIHVRGDGFGKGIDTKASAALQKAWDMMMGHISTRFAHEIDEEVANKLGKEGKDYETLKKSEDVTVKTTLADEMKAAGARIHLNGIPERQLPTKDDGPTDGMAERVANQRSEMLKAAAEKGVVYANKLQLVTVAMTAKKPSVLLFSIHSDSDGYFCAQYLNLAKKFYDTIHDHNDYEITRMYIGMDANVQPPKGHNSWDPKKGFTYTQLEQALPSGMKMLDPGTKTVKKVRTFLQTQFSKIGKDDEEKKDLLFVYPADVVGSTKSNVYNLYAEGTGFSLIDPKEGEPPVYYPTNAWPVDHFMSFATVSEKPQSMGTTVCNALQKTVRETKHKLLTIFTNRKKSLATKSADLAAAALDELKKSTGLLAQVEAAAAAAKLKAQEVVNKTAADAKKTAATMGEGTKQVGQVVVDTAIKLEKNATEVAKNTKKLARETVKRIETNIETSVADLESKVKRFMRAASK